MEYRIWDKIMCKHSTSGLWSITPDGSIYYGNALWPEAEVELFTGHYDNTKWEELTESERERFVRHNNPSEWKGQKVYINDVVEGIRGGLRLVGPVKHGWYSHSKCGEYECEHYGLHIQANWKNYESNTGYDLSEMDLKVVGTIHDRDVYEESDNMCSTCKYGWYDSNDIPCNTCMNWVDGYLEATNYEPNFESLLGDE